MDIQRSIEKSQLQLSFWGILQRFMYAYVLIGVGLIMLYLKYRPRHVQSPFNSSHDWGIISIVFPAMVLIFGVFVFYVADSQLKLTPVDNELPSPEKEKLIRSALKKMGAMIHSREVPGYLSFQLYRGAFYYPGTLEIICLYDDKGIYINVTDLAKRYLLKTTLYHHVTMQVKAAIEAEADGTRYDS